MHAKFDKYTSKKLQNNIKISYKSFVKRLKYKKKQVKWQIFRLTERLSQCPITNWSICSKDVFVVDSIDISTKLVIDIQGTGIYNSHIRDKYKFITKQQSTARPLTSDWNSWLDIIIITKVLKHYNISIR